MQPEQGGLKVLCPLSHGIAVWSYGSIVVAAVTNLLRYTESVLSVYGMQLQRQASPPFLQLLEVQTQF
jgi:hypothetical protein